jgi:uncharacterized membrane protein (GlpM family)
MILPVCKIQPPEIEESVSESNFKQMQIQIQSGVQGIQDYTVYLWTLWTVTQETKREATYSRFSTLT